MNIKKFYELLEGFIDEKLSGYVEPVRKGKKKGERIGYSSVKYHAAVLLLSDLGGAEIARKVGISHGLLRKWQTEKEFSDCTAKACEEFEERLYLKQKGGD